MPSKKKKILNIINNNINNTLPPFESRSWASLTIIFLITFPTPVFINKRNLNKVNFLLKAFHCEQRINNKQGSTAIE